MTKQISYWRCSLRVSALMIERCKGLAAREGWQVADVARVLICLGAAFSFLTLDDRETAERFKTLATLSKMQPMLNVALHKPSRGHRAANGISRTELLPIRLPRGLSETITTYASTSRRTRNEVLAMFLERGFILYLKGQNALLETILSFKQEQEKLDSKADLDEQNQ